MEDIQDLERIEKEEAFIKLLGSKGAKYVLEYLCENKRAQYKDLQEVINTHTLNVRIKGLLHYGLIQHHLVREDVRTEWYELTEKGQKTLDHLNELVRIVE
jgi:DNA-binding HxlR family transcriptional regulator